MPHRKIAIVLLCLLFVTQIPFAVQGKQEQQESQSNQIILPEGTPLHVVTT